MPDEQEPPLTGQALQDAITDTVDELRNWRDARGRWARTIDSARAYENESLLEEAQQEVRACDKHIEPVRNKLNALKRQDAIGAVL